MEMLFKNTTLVLSFKTLNIIARHVAKAKYNITW
jgi:hypothetical protein